MHASLSDAPGLVNGPVAAGWLAPSQGPEIPPGAVDAAAPTWPHAPASDAAPAVAVGWDAGSDAVGETFSVVGPTHAEKPDPVFASALLDEPQAQGLRYLMNYANKSIRQNRGVAEQDRDDLLHDIYMEWWICVGYEPTALPKLLESESPERKSLRDSIYRVFGRYRYRQTAHRRHDLDEESCLDARTLEPGDGRDFALDLDRWRAALPELEAKVIDLYYFQHKTMDEIGAEIGLAKQRVSELHKRALSRHPDGGAGE